MRKFLAFLAASLVLLAVETQWVDLPTPPDAKKAPVRASEWSLPAIPSAPMPNAVTDKLALLASQNLWGAIVPPKDEAPTKPPELRLIGIFTDGKEYQALIQIDSTPAQTIRGGDKLPGAEGQVNQVLKVEHDSVQLLVNKKKQGLTIYQPAARITL